MDFDETLRLIAAAQGKPDQLALVTVEIVLNAQPPVDREILRLALDAAVLPHWFDAALLARLLDLDLAPRAGELFTRLCDLPFVERFPARGETARNVHEATRLPWRARLRAEHPERFRELSLRAAAALPEPNDKTALAPHRIEALYHRLVATPREEGAAQCEALAREWSRAGRIGERQALAGALGELEQAGFLSGVVRAVALMEMTEARWAFQPLEVTARSVETAFNLCEAAGAGRRLSRALLLRGQLAQGRGDLGSALRDFEKCLALRRKCAREHPGDLELESELADSHSYIGDVRLAQGDLAGARSAFEATLAISQKLATQDPANADWQRDLAVSHSKVGDVRLAQGDLAGARSAFEADLAISRELAMQDPANAGWQADLAVTLRKLGSLGEQTGDFATARREWNGALGIYRKLTKLDPTNADWRANAAGLRQLLSELP
jgi:tetratricopeptide (TPR) repeat protein